MTIPGERAASLNAKAKEWLLGTLRGKRVAVPDCVWHGNDCDLIEFSGGGWRVSDFGHSVARQFSRVIDPDE